MWVFFALSWRVESLPPVFDEVQYIRLGQNLAIHGVFAEYKGDSSQPRPTAIREPFYPLVIAGAVLVDARLRDVPVDALLKGDPAYAKNFDLLRYLNVAAIVSTALILFSLLREVSRDWTAPWIGMAFMLLNIKSQDSMSYIISDYLAMLLATAVAWSFFFALGRRAGWPFFIPGLLLGLLALTKTVFLFYAAVAMVVGVGLFLFGRTNRRKRGLFAVLAFAICFLPPVGGWMARNVALFDAPVITYGRGSSTLSAREFLNDMTAHEYAVSFLWWTRGFGDNLARRHLPKESYARFLDDNPQGFYRRGYRRGGEKRKQIMADLGLSRAEAESWT